GNVIAITAPDGSSTQIDYHETLNLPVAVNDPAGRITAYTYDGRGNLVSITDPAGYTTSYGYNARWLQIELRRRIWAGNVPQVTTCNSQKNRMN
ncbi:RHS repeat domain-containing protein, partial [Neisseria lactamica]|uniref:RHS repeat domain-containing protein n=1 Tax=Neisseria lactamica TaxID=486 RepID=UPI0005AAB98C